MVSGTRMGVCMRNGFFESPPDVVSFQVVRLWESLTAHFNVDVGNRLRLLVGSPRSKRVVMIVQGLGRRWCMAIWRQERVDSACLRLDVTSERRSNECRLKRGKADRTTGIGSSKGWCLGDERIQMFAIAKVFGGWADLGNAFWLPSGLFY